MNRWLALALAVTMVGTTFAQGPGGGFGGPGQGGSGQGGPGQGGPGGRGPGMGGPGMGMRGGPGMILLSKEYKDDLKLSDAQVEKIKALVPQRGPGGPGEGRGGPGGRGPGGPPEGGPGGFGQGGPPPEGGPGGFGQGRPPQGGGFGEGRPGGQRGPGGPGGRQGELDKKLKEILNETQFKRHQQIMLQVEAPASIGRPEVAEKLGLTEAQREKLFDVMGSARPEPGQAPPKREEFIAKALNVLNASQKAQWKEMTGKPFQMPQPPARRDN